MDYVSSYWSGEDVNVNRVKAALVQALRELNPPAEPGQIHPPVRASLLNRIVRLAPGLDEPRIRQALEELAEIHPSRTVMVATDPAAPSGLDATASARCQLRSGTQPRVCFEEVQLAARGDLARHLSSVVEPLLIPDMPVVLWWFGAPPGEDEGLLQLCDRLVLDSDPAGPAALPHLRRLVEALCPARIVTDLAWAQLAPWRELLSQLFDPVETRPFQRRLDSLEVEYAAGIPTTRPLLLVGWLATSLGWQLAKPGDPGTPDEPRLRFRTADGTLVEARIGAAPAWGALQPGDLLRVTLRAHLDRGEAAFSVARHEDRVCATLHTALPDRQRQDRTVPLAPPSWASLLSGELDRRRADPVYRSALALAAEAVSP